MESAPPRRPSYWILLGGVFATACGGPPGPSKRYTDAERITDPEASGDTRAGDIDAGDAHAGDTDAGDAAGAGDSAAGDPGGDGALCPLGHLCNPIPIESFPFNDVRDTTLSTSAVVDAYACAPATDESGPEYFYQLTVSEPGLLWAAVDDQAGDNIDIDLHLLADPSGTACLSRNNVALGWFLTVGTYLLVADTWVSSVSGALAGPYQLTVQFFPAAGGACAMTPTQVTMFWTECDPALDCTTALDATDGVVRGVLTTPAFGPVVGEAHLVTVADDFGGGWPQSFTDGIDAHYTASQGATGYVATRSEPWAPAGEGGSQYGQAAIGTYLPVLAEAWYVNMYWRYRPTAGTRLLVINPENGRAVVAAGGYETGPGANTAIGGAVEEIHLYLGTTHRDRLVFAFAADQGLAYGPIDCGW